MSYMVVHRASGDLRLNLHYHALFLDGGYDIPARRRHAREPNQWSVE